MTEAQKVLGQGPSDKTSRRYHFAIPFPDAQPDFGRDDKKGWGDPRLRLVGGCDRLGHILAGLLAEPVIIQATVRSYNICFSVDDAKSSVLEKTWAQIDQRVVELAGEPIRIYHRVLSQTTVPACEIVFEEYPYETAIGPAPQNEYTLDLPDGFATHMMEWVRGRGQIGMVPIRDARRCSEEQLTLLERLQRIQGVSRVRFVLGKLQCSLGLAFDQKELGFKIEHTVATTLHELSRTLQPA